MMNFLLLTITPKKNQKMIRDIATELANRGYGMFIVCPSDDQNLLSSNFVKIDGINYLFVDSGYSVGKVGIIKKVSNMLLIDGRFKNAIKKAAKNLKFDVVLYSTPPITLVNTILWVKKHFKAVAYLMLKDIFPQNAVDLGMMKKCGITAPIYFYFRNKEKKLYKITDYIGCMSLANKNYVLKNNLEIAEDKVGICVNSYKYEEQKQVDVNFIRNKFDLPTGAMVFLYGGNLGKPQGLSYFVEVLRENINKSDRFFLICGSGNDQATITDFINNEKPANVKFMTNIPPDDFDELTAACDVGMVFLDNRFSIPNFPSRMLSIMINAKPILAATDVNTDIDEIINDGDLGWWCESGATEPMNDFINGICEKPEIAKQKGLNARKYFETHYTTEICCNQILEGIEKIK